MILLIGTSGWSYDDWIGPFYKDKRARFSRYAKIFHTSEINSTFYRYPTEGLVRGLMRTAPSHFIFASKLPGEITHDKWLRVGEGIEDDTLRFLHIMRPLAEKLGPILIQLRPKFNYEEHFGDLETFLEMVPHNFEWAVEFRNISWLRDETFKLLRKNNVAYTVVDEPLLPSEVHVTADFSYIRWHGHGSRIWYDYEYEKKELEEWVPKIREIENQTRRTYGYFNNHFNANAVKNAVELLDMLNMTSQEQLGALNQINDFKASANRPLGVKPLMDFSTLKDELSIADILMHFTTASRLSRAEEISEKEVKIIDIDEKNILAKIRGYHINIDLETRVIEHNCDDWRKGAYQKRMCKHMDKLFLTLPENVARRTLSTIFEDKEKWIFQTTT